MKPSSDPPKLENPLTIDEEDDDFDIVINNSGKEAYNPFAPQKDDSEEIVLINNADGSAADIPIPKFEVESKKCLDEKNLIDSDSITDNDTFDSLTTFISTLDHYEALLNKRKKEKTTTFDSFQQLLPAREENDLKVSANQVFILYSRILKRS